MFSLNLEDKVILITGASDGLGFASAKLLSQLGAKVAICGRRGDYLLEKANLIRKETNNEVLAIKCDVTDTEQCNYFVKETITKFNHIDVLVNNAGTSAAFSFETISDQAWEDDINLKLMASVRMCRLVLPYMKSRGVGSIINAAIGGGKAPKGSALPTTVTRAAGINLSKSLSNEYAKFNIRVNAICIGLIKSAQWERKNNYKDMETFYKKLSEQIPLGRVGNEIDYANLVAFLSSERSSYITGTAINIDGGLCPVV